jgi:transcriptional regulator with XRE-family HTH domain
MNGSFGSASLAGCVILVIVGSSADASLVPSEGLWPKRSMDNVGRSGFGALLRRFRLEVGLSQEGLAERARTSVETVGALERGARRAPYRDTVTLLADALGLSAEKRTQLETASARPQRARGQPLVDDVAAQVSSFIADPALLAGMIAQALRHQHEPQTLERRRSTLARPATSRRPRLCG